MPYRAEGSGNGYPAGFELEYNQSWVRMPASRRPFRALLGEGCYLPVNEASTEEKGATR